MYVYGEAGVAGTLEPGWSDEQLIRAIARRDESALRRLYECYANRLYALALRVLGDRELAEEVIQDVFLRVWDNAASYANHRGSVTTWLFSITRNRAIDMLRSKQHRQASLESALEPGHPFEPHESDHADMVVLQQLVRNALTQLTPEQRQIIELAYYSGQTQSQMATLLGEPLGTIKSRLRLAMERLRQFLKAMPEQTGDSHA